MLFRALGASALAATAANAILIPPSIAADLADDNAVNPMEVPVIPHKRTVAVECPTCAVASRHDGELLWQQDAGSSFLLDFEVGAGEDTLNIDGVQLYPPTFGYFTAPFLLTQVDPTLGDDLRLRVTGYTFHYSPAETFTEAGIELLPMTFRITSIEDKPVDPPAIIINLLKDTNGRLMIANFQTAKATDASPSKEDQQCKGWPLLCKWRAIIHDKFNSVKASIRRGCHKFKARPSHADAMHDRHHHKSRPSHKHSHHRPHYMAGEHHHHSHNRVHTIFRRVLFTIIVPVLVGIFAGTLTYLIGKALGTLIASISARFRRQNPYQRIALDSEVDLEDAKEHSDMDEEDFGPPKYVAVPTVDEPAEDEAAKELK